MPIYIRYAEADRLVRELADLTGESITEAVMAALRERLEREREQRGRHRMLEQLTRIGERYRALPLVEDRPVDAVLEYDERGLPRGA